MNTYIGIFFILSVVILAIVKSKQILKPKIKKPPFTVYVDRNANLNSQDVRDQINAHTAELGNYTPSV